MDKEVVLTEFAKVINSDRYQYTESDIFLMEHMEEKEAVLMSFLEKLKMEALQLFQECKR